MVNAAKTMYETRRRYAQHNLKLVNWNKYANPKLKNSPDGRRVVHLQTLGENLICKSCREVLSPQAVIFEKKCGAAGIFLIQCRKCLSEKTVPSDKVHETSEGKIHFDVNSKITMGAIHSGLGCTHVNKVLATMNIPTVNWKTFKRHEREVGDAVKKVDRKSCEEATILKWKLTIENEERIVQLV